MTDALRDAGLLAAAHLRGGESELGEHQRERDAVATEMLRVSDAIASFGWNLQSVQEDHQRLSRLMARESAILAALSESHSYPWPRVRRRTASPERRTLPMARFLIEVAHEEETVACERVVKVFLETGSHFLTHVDWGCTDGDHRGWTIVDVENRDEARRIVPPAFRAQAHVVQLNQFRMGEIDQILQHHRG